MPTVRADLWAFSHSSAEFVGFALQLAETPDESMKNTSAHNKTSTDDDVNRCELELNTNKNLSFNSKHNKREKHKPNL